MDSSTLVSRAKFWADSFEHCPSMMEIEANKARKASDYERGVDFAARLINKLNPSLGFSVNPNELKNSLSPYGYKASKGHRVFERVFADEIIERYTANFQTNLHDVIAFDAIAILYETCDVLIGESISLGNLQTEMAGLYSTFYAAVRTIEKLDADAFKRHAKVVSEEAIGRIDQAAQDQKDALVKQISNELQEQLANTLKEIQKKTSETFSAIADEKETILRNFENEAEIRLNNKIEALTSNLILTDAIEMWRKKSTGHKWAFWLATLAFVVLVFSPLALGFTHAENLIRTIEELFPASGEIPFGRLLVVTVPLLGYAWILRLVSRYLTQNLNLGHDADLRRVMARTFVQLVSEGAAKDDQDRATILSALFRPLPGTNADDDQPPNVIGMIKKEILPDQKS